MQKLDLHRYRFEEIQFQDWKIDFESGLKNWIKSCFRFHIELFAKKEMTSLNKYMVSREVFDFKLDWKQFNTNVCAAQFV